jgi:hypothetical protein
VLLVCLGEGTQAGILPGSWHQDIPGGHFTEKQKWAPFPVHAEPS